MKNLDINDVRRREYINNFYGLKNLIYISLLYITFFVFSITLVILYNNIISYLVIFIFSSKIGLFMVKKIFSIDLDYKLFNSRVANYFLLILIGFVLSIIVGLAP